MDSVCAFVLTHNRQHLLVETLRALLGQTRPIEQVIVLDNASTDGTLQRLRSEGLLDEPQIAVHRNEANTGGAAGYQEGMRLALAEGRDWIWLMDDDAEPRPDALERLLAAPPASDAGTAVLCTAVVHPDGSVDRMHRCRLARLVLPLGEEIYAHGRYADVDCASFVGFMVRRRVAEAAGLPLADYFLGYDDAEYSLRARAHGRIRLVPESVIVHKIPIGGGLQTRRSRLWNRLTGAQYASSPWPAYWKDLYRVRNFMAMRVAHGGLAPLEFWALTAGYVIKAILYEDRPLRRIPWIVGFARRGRALDFTAPTPDEWAARAR